jgi:ABC-2 type transport system permease protein
MFLAVVRTEWRIQRREPLVVLYAIILGLLAAVFAAAGPIDLVTGRGAVPRGASWSITLACTSITAFGQVITTMVTATTVLRDRADRFAGLVLVSRLSTQRYLAAKLVGALSMLCLVYLAIPVGIVLGTVLHGGSGFAAMHSVVRPMLLLVLPTMLAVGALQFGAAVLSQRLWVVLGVGLSLIWLWSAVTDAVTVSGTGGVATWLDPFGAAPVLAATRDWSDAMRSSVMVPITSDLIVARLVWFCIGAVVAALAIARGERATRSVGAARLTREGAADVAPPLTAGRRQEALLRAPAARPAWVSAAATARFVMLWLVRDAGWRVLTLLGALNVAIHVGIDVANAGVGGAEKAVASAVALHSQLFLILLATIYAGELVWRDRDDRSLLVFDVLPVTEGARMVGRILGVAAAQGAVIATIGLAAGLATLVAGGAPELLRVAGASAASLFVPFVLWFLLALVVHVAVMQKLLAHLLCIAGWAAVIAIRGAVPSPTGEGALDPWVSLLFGGAAALVSWRVWDRGAETSRWDRWRDLRARFGRASSLG